LGETLAMSNLAEKFISAGFLQEARDECTRALAGENVHENVGHTLGTIAGIPVHEDEQEGKVVERAVTKSSFFAQFGHATARSEPKKFIEKWDGPGYVLTVTLDGSNFKAVGFYELFGLAAFLAGPIGGFASPPLPERMRVEYSGIVRGFAIVGSVSRTKEGAPPKSIIEAAGDIHSVIMILSDDERELRVMESFQKVEPSYYELRAKGA
jgi:hypothetical protein